MNNTRKAIIELIEPYMDKNLSERCLILGNLHINGEPADDSSMEYKTITGKIEKASNGITYIYSNGEEYDVYNIIGHYDITSVLKYIRNNEDRYPKIYGNSFIIEDEDGCIISDKGAFLNKPLHLYTEQEEKDLLKLLKSLG